VSVILSPSTDVAKTERTHSIEAAPARTARSTRRWLGRLTVWLTALFRLIGQRILQVVRFVRPASKKTGANHEWAWERFNPVAYFQHNYGNLRKDDRQILLMVRDFFTDHFAAIPDEEMARRPLRGLDIGSGANLYPALTMLPFCGRITLRDFAPANVRWMRNEVKDPHESWQPFWKVLARARPYREVRGKYAQLLSDRAVVQHGSIFDLHKNLFDIGTMFFVAESLTIEHAEFEEAVTRFVQSLRGYAPFACAFMRNSSGYRVDGWDFPAVAIDEADVKSCLDKVAYDVDVHVIELRESGTPLREGYGGMIVATGWRRAQTR